MPCSLCASGWSVVRRTARSPRGVPLVGQDPKVPRPGLPFLRVRVRNTNRVIWVVGLGMGGGLVTGDIGKLSVGRQRQRRSASGEPSWRPHPWLATPSCAPGRPRCSHCGGPNRGPHSRTPPCRCGPPARRTRAGQHSPSVTGWMSHLAFLRLTVTMLRYSEGQLVLPFPCFCVVIFPLPLRVVFAVFLSNSLMPYRGQAVPQTCDMHVTGGGGGGLATVTNPSDVLERPYTAGGGGYPPPPLPFQCLRLTAKILLRRQEDLSLKFFGPPLAGALGGGEGGSQIPPPFLIYP